ncbi:MAG: CDP-alcohol phosphatidyltransferase family protein [Rhodothermales bacterium]|nr:CDP-alcohol phosphatidyltransferase family protein [Rhodothermales bacterium]
MPNRSTRPKPAFPDLGRFWTVANGLTLLRMALVVPIALLVYRGGPFDWLMGLVLFAIATDWFDGRIARWSNTVSEWGKVLDPTADKLAAAAVTLALVLRPPSAGATLPLWFVAVVIVRDVLIAVGGFIQTRRIGRVLMSLWSGKVAVTALALTVVAALLDADPEVLVVCLWGTTALLFYSLFRYLWRFGRVMRGLPVADGPGAPVVPTVPEQLPQNA